MIIEFKKKLFNNMNGVLVQTYKNLFGIYIISSSGAESKEGGSVDSEVFRIVQNGIEFIMYFNFFENIALEIEFSMKDRLRN